MDKYVATFDFENKTISTEFDILNNSIQAEFDIENPSIETTLDLVFSPQFVSQLINDKGYVTREELDNVTKASFIFEQYLASSIWEIQHDLNRFPSVTVVDSAGNEIISEVIYIDNNNIKIVFKASFKGKAFLN